MKKSYRKCIICGKNFTPLAQDPSAVNKCPECAAKARRDSVIQLRTCIKCGRVFEGFPNSKYCNSCAYEAQLETKKRHQSNPNTRKIGDTDKCERCGKEYVIKGGRQRYCPECQRQATLETQRERKKLRRLQDQRNEHSKAVRKKRQKVCIYCGKVFNSSSPSPCCSDECRKKNKHLCQTRWMYEHGKSTKENLNKYERLQQEEMAKNRGK